MPSKKKITSNKIPSPFGETAHKTERSAVAILMHWMREIIEKDNLDLGMPDVETVGEDRKMPDVVIYESRRSQKVLCLIEAKPPYYDVFDEKELKEPARKKATERKAKYFALTNFKKLIWYSTEKVNSLQPEEEQIKQKYSLSELENLDDIEQTRHSESLKRGFADFLKQLHSVHIGKEPEPKQAIDELLIYRLHEKIRVLSTYYKRIIEDECHKDSSFSKKLSKWFIDQGWNFSWQSQDFQKAARQTAYLLVNKILFYNLLQAKRKHDLDPLEIPEGLTKSAMLQVTLHGYFSQVLKIDYETIYTTDFIDTIAFPDAKEVVIEIKELVYILKQYDFSKLGYDVIGRIFERLIPQDERHNLGQYFTSPDVVDVILRFCLHHENDKILDPSCGAGTFLVRAYQHKKLMNQRLEHEKILESLWGTDIAKFPAHLATINLAINDLGVDKNYPNILQEDFFTILVGDKGFDPENWRKRRAKTLGLKEREVIHPRWFDAVVGNPPYTRQEEISEIAPEDFQYKQNLIKSALYFHDKKMAEVGKRAGIHAYFFVHGAKFLKDGGFFGFIVSNSWLDTDYGKGLQEFFLKNFKIICIIESKVERWFEDADINTCIVILQKCAAKKEREENLVRFVYLKNPFKNLMPPAHDMWEKQVARLNAIDQLKRTILAHHDFYENDDLRIFPKLQQELWEEGFDPEEKKYVGTKWGKYTRAPLVLHKCLNSGKLIQIKDSSILEAKRGLRPGAAKYFYLTPDQIEKNKLEVEFTSPLLRSPQNLSKIKILEEEITFRVLDVQLPKEELRNKSKNILKYINRGEKEGINNKNIVSRNQWYSLPTDEYKATIVIPEAFDDTFIVYYASANPVVDQRFNIIISKSKIYEKILLAYFNSSFFWLVIEVIGRTALGLGALDFPSTDLNQAYVPTTASLKIKSSNQVFKLLTEIMERNVGSVFEEIGANSIESVALEKVKPDRRELDKIIMGEILGLTDAEQLEVYRAVVDLVKSRIEKARSFGKRNKTKEGIDVDSFKAAVIERIKREPEP